MWLVPLLLLGQSIALPPETPIPCLVCTAPADATLVFSGTVQLAQGGRLRIFNGKSRQTMGFTVPAGFHGVESSDGKIKDAALDRVPPGLLARVTYRSAGGHAVVSRVLLLTINQCRELVAAERLSNTAVECPD